MWWKRLWIIYELDFYLSGINKLPDEYPDFTKNNGEYTIDWNWFMALLFIRLYLI